MVVRLLETGVWTWPQLLQPLVQRRLLNFASSIDFTVEALDV